MLYINANTLPPSEASPYLGMTITFNNSNWAAVYLNLRKDRMRWGMIGRVLERTVVTVQARGEIYKAVDQSVLLYGSKSWVVTGEMLKVLTAFHHWAERRIMGMTENHGSGGEWEHPAVEEAMDSAGLQPIGVYIKRWQTTITERVSCRPVYALCTEVERMTGTSWIVRCWDQGVVNDPEA